MWPTLDEVRRFEGWRLSSMWISAVEVSQGIQYSRSHMHLEDKADRQPDNSLTLVADKPAWVRIYVSSFHAIVPDVRATVVVQRRRLGVWVDDATLTSQGSGSITVDPAQTYEDQRGRLANSLNFVIPSRSMRGQMRLKVHVGAVGDPGLSDDTVVDIAATLLQTLRVRAFAIQYDGPDAAGTATINLPAPTLADLQATVAWTLLTWPVSQTPELSILGPTLWSEPLTGAITVDPSTQQSQCPTSWNNLLTWLTVGKWFDGSRSDVFYYGLLPNGIPIGGAGGCGGGTVAAGFVGDGIALAHELGHSVGYNHAPCGLPAGDAGDPNYPMYEPYAAASIGEYGLDINTGTILPPNTGRDIMSYCGPRWPSLYHYRGLIQHERLHPRWVSDPGYRPPVWEELGTYDPILDRPDPPPPWVGRDLITRRPPERQSMVALAGSLTRGVAEVSFVARLEMEAPIAGRAVSGLRIELVGDRGQVLTTGPVFQTVNQASECGCVASREPIDADGTGRIEAHVEDNSEAVGVRLVRDSDDAEVWSLHASGEPPRIRGFDIDLRDEAVRLSWELDAESEWPVVGLRWSADGEAWTLLAMPTPGVNEVELDTAGLTGRSGAIQLVVLDGFYTVIGDPVRVEFPSRPPAVNILFPPDGAHLRHGQSLRLWGIATGLDGETLYDDDVMWWQVDGAEAGTGVELWLDRQLEPGEHEVVLSVETRGGSARAVSQITLVDVDHPSL
jgi:hypothetical protein